MSVVTDVPDVYEDLSLASLKGVDAQKLVEDKTICLFVTLRKQGVRRKVSSLTDAISTDTDRRMLGINKLIIISPELESIQKLDGQIRAYLMKESLDVASLQRGCYLFPTSLVPTVYERLSEFKQQRDELVTAYQLVYPVQRNEAQMRLRSLYDPDNYPETGEIPYLFKMTWKCGKLPGLDPSNALQSVNAAIYKHEMDKAAEMCKELLVEVEEGLMGAMGEFIDHLIGCLGYRENGSPKIFKASTVNNFAHFLDQLPQLNITNNADLVALGEKAKALMEGVEATNLRKDLDFREEVRKKLSQFKQDEVAKALRDRPKRRFNFDVS